MTRTSQLVDALSTRHVAKEYLAAAENKALALLDGPCVSDEQQAEIRRAHKCQEDLLEWLRPMNDDYGWRKANVEVATATGVQYAQLYYATPYGDLQIFPSSEAALLTAIFSGDAIVCKVDRRYSVASGGSQRNG